MSSSGDGAELKLGLYPSQVGTIPRNVTARIEPKTLFGEKYVALQVPEQPDERHIEAGDTIKQTVVAAEVEQTLNDLYPLLRTVQPAELNKTLNALATALEGRGDAIGTNLETLDGYLKRLNPKLPAAIEDLRLLTKTSDLYTEVFPDIADDAAQLRDDRQHAGRARAEAQPAVPGRVRVLRHHAHLPRRERVEPHPGQPARRRPAARLRQVRPRVPLPHQGHRQRGQAAGPGVPRVHAAHQPRAAAQPAACLRPPGQAAVRRQARPLLRHAAQPAVQPEEHRPVPRQRERRCRRADRQGHQPHRAAAGPRARRTPGARPRPTSSAPCSPPRWGATPRRCPT